MPCDRSWMNARLDNVGFLFTEFINGVNEFVDFAFSQHAFVSRNRIKCPCVKCDNRLLQTRNDVIFHLHSKGFTGDYTVWVAHGEDDDDDVVSESNRVDDVAAEPSNSANLVDNSYRRMVIDSCYPEFDSAGGGTSFSEELPNSSAAKFFGLLKDADEPLYSGCNKHTKLSAIAQFLNVKSEFNLSASCYDRIMTIEKDLLPTDEKLPANFYKAKQMVTTLGLSYVKIHACPNNCMLYYSETESMTECVVCGHPRYKPRTQSRDRSKKNNDKYADEMIKKYGSEDAAKNHEFDPEVWSKVVGGVGHEPCNEESSQSAHIGTQAELEEIVKQVLDGVLPQCLQDALRNLGFQLPNPPTSGSTPRDDGVDTDEGEMVMV
ncbi:hypothetical protein CCACVL1_22575 [Corchorus capsularis]|uniref:Transposase-associated domain-containing protein n=1 Tax=Corchorus capsularis TaxID=210143 RepID=A0A1R3GXZ9_COCAP|nr:hypothetical protein CCACVL1_22575 [Corchorus capsularis]